MNSPRPVRDPVDGGAGSLSARDMLPTMRKAVIGDAALSLMHSLVNPLMLILGHAHAIRSSLAPDSAQIESAEMIQQAAQRIDQMARAVVQFADPGIQEGAATVEEACQTAARFLESELKRVGVELSIKADSTLPALTIGRTDLMFVLLVILRQSIRALESAGRRFISIRAEVQSEMVHLQIADTRNPSHVPDPAVLDREALWIAIQQVLRLSGGALSLSAVEGGFSFELMLPPEGRSSVGVSRMP